MSRSPRRQAGFTLEPVPPFRLDLTAWTLRRRAENAVDRWDGQTYRRVLPLSAGLVDVSVTQTGPPEQPQLQVRISGARKSTRLQHEVTQALERLLGLRIDLAEFYDFAKRDKRLGPLAERFKGMKPPRFLTVFESLANAIACQQLTLTFGIQTLNRLAELAGPACEEAQSAAHAFPRPEDLVSLTGASLRPLGFSRQKAEALIGLAGALCSGTLDLEALSQEPDDVALERLLAIRGVGRWSAEYALLRGLGRLHVFPGDDVGGRNNLQRWLGRAGPLDYEGVRKTLAPWRKYGGLIYFHVLLDRIAEKLPGGFGKVSGETEREEADMANIQLKRAYEEPARGDGTRILVERLWPRGLSKERAAVDVWLKDVAPSPALRKWFGHDPARWAQFEKRYWAELEQNADAVAALKQILRKGRATFVYAARDEAHNGALALKEYLSKRKGRS